MTHQKLAIRLLFSFAALAAIECPNWFPQLLLSSTASVQCCFAVPTRHFAPALLLQSALAPAALPSTLRQLFRAALQRFLHPATAASTGFSPAASDQAAEHCMRFRLVHQLFVLLLPTPIPPSDLLPVCWPLLLSRHKALLHKFRLCAYTGFQAAQ